MGEIEIKYGMIQILRHMDDSEKVRLRSFMKVTGSGAKENRPLSRSIFILLLTCRHRNDKTKPSVIIYLIRYHRSWIGIALSW